MESKNNIGLTMKYFVLKPNGKDDYAIASRKAIFEYAANIRGTNDKLATDLCCWVVDCQLEADEKSSYMDYKGAIPKCQKIK